MEEEMALYCNDVADWIERTRTEARRTGNFDTRCLIQNVELIVTALRDVGLRAKAGEQSK